jgi:hypothetical protein
MLLDAFSNMPRAQVSDSVMKLILWMMKHSGSKDVPSFKRLQAVQRKLREQSGVKSLAQESALKNKFHVNDPRSIIEQVCRELNYISLCYLLRIF